MGAGNKTKGFVSAACATPAAAANGIYLELSALLAGVNDMENLGVVEIGFIIRAATETSVALQRATPGTPDPAGIVTPESEYEDTTVQGVGWLYNLWSVDPIIKGSPMRQVTLPATAGASVVWTWDPESPLIVPQFTSVVLVNFGAAAGSVMDAWAKWSCGLITNLLNQRTVVGTPIP